MHQLDQPSHHRMILNPMRPGLLLATLVAIFAAFTSGASADEGGVPFWLSGQYASFAAVPASAGWSMPVMTYFYSGNVSDEKELRPGNLVTAGLDSSLPMLFVQPTYAPKTRIWGAQAAFGVGFGLSQNTASASVFDTAIPGGLYRSDSVTGLTDLYPVASLSWTKGNNNWMAYLTGDIPVGSYDPNRLANIGIGHAAVDGGGGYTYFNASSGREFSAVLGVTYNFENNDTDYQNGIDIHLDWAVSQYLNKNWQVGIAGYLYDQLTGDSGPQSFQDGLKSSVASIGPEIGFSFTMNGQPAYINLRGYWEFAAKNRVEGAAFFTTLSLPLGKQDAGNSQ